MPQRVITAAVGVAGLVVIGLGVASATVWKADDVLVATATASGSTITTDPGVLELGGDPVTVRATTAGNQPVVLAVGRDTDVAGWIGSDAHTQVTGLSSWHDLATTPGKGTATATASAGSSSAATSSAAPSASAKPVPSPSPSTSAAADAAGTGPTVADPTDSDLWVAQATGKGSAQLVWSAQPGRWSLIVVGTGSSSPTVQMSWPRVVTTPWLWPLVVIGSLLVLVSAFFLGRDVYRRRTGTEVPEWQPVTTGTIAMVGEDGAPLTRRQIREAELARAARPRTGAVPRVAEPQPLDAAVTADGVPPGGTANDDGGRTESAGGTPTSADARPTTSSAPATPEREIEPRTAPTTAIPTTRRALRTGAIPTVSRSDASADPGSVPASATPTTSATPESSAPRDAGATPPAAPIGSEPGATPAQPRTRRTVSAPGWLAGAGRRAQPDSAAAREGAPEASAAPTAAIPQATSAGQGTWAPAAPPRPTSVGQSSAAPADPGARAAGAAPAAHGADGPPAAPAAPDGRSGSHRPAWLPVHAPGTDAAPPHTSRPSAAAGADQPPGDPARPADQPGSRADAWRRAWGLPPTEDAPQADPQTDDPEEDR